jgi:hypothetical protein
MACGVVAIVLAGKLAIPPFLHYKETDTMQH